MFAIEDCDAQEIKSFDKLEAEWKSVAVEQKRVATERERLDAEQERLNAKREKLEVEWTRLEFEHERLEAECKIWYLLIVLVRIGESTLSIAESLGIPEHDVIKLLRE